MKYVYPALIAPFTTHTQSGSDSDMVDVRREQLIELAGAVQTMRVASSSVSIIVLMNSPIATDFSPA